MKHFNFFFFTQLKNTTSAFFFYQDWIPQFRLCYLTFMIIIECLFRTIWLLWSGFDTKWPTYFIFYVKCVEGKITYVLWHSPFILYNFNNHMKSKPDEIRTVIHYFTLPSSWNKVKFTKRTNYRGTAQFFMFSVFNFLQDLPMLNTSKDGH